MLKNFNSKWLSVVFKMLTLRNFDSSILQKSHKFASAIHAYAMFEDETIGIAGLNVVGKSATIHLSTQGQRWTGETLFLIRKRNQPDIGKRTA